MGLIKIQKFGKNACLTSYLVMLCKIFYLAQKTQKSKFIPISMNSHAHFKISLGNNK